MITRLVKLEILPEHADTFAAFFAREAKQISAWEGCLGVKAFRDSDSPERFFTQSLWVDERALEQYRRSDFFRGNWAQVKQWFAAPAVAWSTVLINEA